MKVQENILQMLGGYETKESSTKRKDERNNVNLPSKHKQKERRCYSKEEFKLVYVYCYIKYELHCFPLVLVNLRRFVIELLSLFKEKVLENMNIKKKKAPLRERMKELTCKFSN